MAMALQKIEDQLSCVICLQTFTNPKQLLCHHEFCQQCLVNLAARDRHRQLSLTCPSCRRVTPVPANGVEDLPSAFRVKKLLEIVKEHKKPEDTTSIPVGCLEHGGREVELHCDTCRQEICYKCIKKGEKHHSHHYKELSEPFERYKKEISSFMESLEKRLTNMKKSLAKLDARRDEISEQEAAIEADVNNTITRLHGTLDIRKTELNKYLHQISQDKLKSLAVQRDQIETTQAQLSSCLYFIRENLKTGNQGTTLRSTIRKVKELFQSDMKLLEASTEADMIFTTSKDLTECRKFGMISAGPPFPSKCCAKGKGIDTAAVGENSTVLLQTLNFISQPCKVSMTSISCELVSEIDGTLIEGTVEARGESQYEISYQPTIKGMHQLRIQVEGQDIMDSPFDVSAMSPVENLSIPILRIAGVRGPEGVIVNKDGEVVVTESDAHCVTVYSQMGKRLRSFGTRGSGQGQFEYPRGVAVDSDGYVLVADRGNNRIQKFTAQGEFLTDSGPLPFEYPNGIAFNASNDRVYVASGKGCIQILTSDLCYESSFGKRGSAKGQFDVPQHIACDSNGNVYVADYNNYCIQVFTAEGNFMKLFGSRGEGWGNLNGPYGIAIDSNGRVYVSEEYNNRVSVFTSECQFLTSFGRWGEHGSWEDGNYERGESLNHPYGLAVNACGVVYVCNHRNNCVMLF